MNSTANTVVQEISMTAFKDHFSGHAGLYSRFRPDYPPTLFRFLAGQAKGHTLAWDCATGNGQAALGLAPYFDNIIATDASNAQLEKAIRAENITYRIAPAEQSGLADASVDLVTVAQALHWFDLDAFYAEVKRVLKPGGILAAWSYNLLQCDPEIDALIKRLYTEIVGPYWPPERAHIETGYRNLPFPFDGQPSPKLAMQADWNQEQLLGYLRTWSAVQRYLNERGSDPLSLIEQELCDAWGDPGKKRRLRWPLTLRWGYR